MASSLTTQPRRQAQALRGTSNTTNFGDSRAVTGVGATPQSSSGPVDYTRPVVTQLPPAGSEEETRNTILNPAPITNVSAINPLQERGVANTQAAFDQAQRFAASLPDLSNEYNTRALQNARDLASGMALEAETGGARRGGVGSGLSELTRNRSLDSSTRSLHKLQGELTDVALGRQNEANAGMTSAAGGTSDAATAAAAEQRMLHLGTLAAQNAAQEVLIRQAESQARLNAAPYDRLMSMMDSVSRNRDSYDAFSGGGGSGFGGGGSGGGLFGIGGSGSGGGGSYSRNRYGLG